MPRSVRSILALFLFSTLSAPAYAADIVTGTVVAYLAVRDPSQPWRQRHPNLGHLSDRLEQRESFRTTRPVPQVISDKVV